MDFFNNESETITIGDLTIENRVGRVEIYGSITRDKVGLTAARALMLLAEKIWKILLFAPNLPDTLPVEEESVEVVENPFTPATGREEE